MFRFLTILALASPSIPLAGQTDAAATEVKVGKKGIPAISLLPDGSQLKGVMLPRYDENHRLEMVLTAEAMTLVSVGEVSGRTIAVELYNPDQSSRGRADLAHATFFQDSGLLKSEEAVSIRTDRLIATGGGIYYLMESGRGFMRGPATTTLLQKKIPATTMTFPDSPLRATVALGVSLFSQALLAAPPPPVTEAERATIQADAVTRAPAAAAAAEISKAGLAADLAEGEKASAAAKGFILGAGISNPGNDPIPPPDKPLDLEAAPTDTVVHCEGGFYFDPEEGVLVYLKNVTVKDPRFSLSGANELKIFFSKKEVAPPAVDPNKKPNDTPPSDGRSKEPSGFGGVGANFGDVEKLVATGAVLIDRKGGPGEDDFQASGAIFIYNVKSDQITLSGGYPWFVHGKNRARATQPNLILKVSPKTFAFSTEGIWDMSGNLEKKR